jgi:uncharacterized delta-60 repeat protein
MHRARLTGLTSIALGVLALTSGTAFAAPGDLDPTFSADGKLVLPVSEGRDNDVAVDLKGRIVVVGLVDPAGATTSDFQVVRYLPNGNLDPSFSGDGIATFDVGGIGENDDAHAVEVDSQGRILVGGYASDGTDLRVAVARLTDAGVPDPTYGGGDGFFIQDLDPANRDEINDIDVDASGRVAAAGIIGTSMDPNALVLRVTPAGEIDTTFAPLAGFAAFAFDSAAGSDDRGWGVAIDSQDRVVVAGDTVLTVGENNFAAARFTAQGELDTSFSNDVSTPGSHIEPMSSEIAPDQQDVAFDVEIAAGDRPRLAGFAEQTGANDNFAVLGLDVNGAPDASFSGDGKAYLDFGGEDDPLRLAIDRNGALILVGATFPLPAGESQVALGRLTSSGAPDTSFSGDAKVLTDIGPGDDGANGVALDPITGRIVIAGPSGPFLTSDWAVARYEGVPRCGGKIPTLTGTSGKDKLKGGKGKDKQVQ